mmetsp:Transcript_24824/g.39862  ORF Transcript_24824/g.39862 Transcript_24824/m.39862 type:complete len:83 (-) Transcript_24824:887-1135(-)
MTGAAVTVAGRIVGGHITVVAPAIGAGMYDAVGVVVTGGKYEAVGVGTKPPPLGVGMGTPKDAAEEMVTCCAAMACIFEMLA